MQVYYFQLFYQSLPYNENESAQIDIEKLLLNKAVTVDLGVRKGKNQAGEEQEYQNITYKVIKPATTPTPATAPATPAQESAPVATQETAPVAAEENSIPNLADDTIWDQNTRTRSPTRDH